jgi:hypothetical protein
MEGISDNPATFHNIKNTVADKIHEAADSIRRKSDSPDAPAVLSTYGMQASTLLDRSAECIREFDIKQADTQIQEQIRSNPGRSLLIALGAGLLIGIWLRRR